MWSVLSLLASFVHCSKCEQEGIFRLAPDMDESTMVKKALNENKFVRCDDINCIANLIKGNNNFASSLLNIALFSCVV